MRSESRDKLVDLDEGEVESTYLPPLPRSGSYKAIIPTSPSKYPILSTRQSSINTPRNPSPTRPSPIKLQQLTTATPIPSTKGEELKITSPRRSLSASFQLPTIPDTSMIGDCVPPSLNDESMMDFEIETLRPKDQPRMASATEDVYKRSATPIQTPGSSSPMDRPNKTPTRSVRMKSSTSIWALAQSTLLPSSPAMSADLLVSTNALSRVDPPWTGNESQASPQGDNVRLPAHTSPSKTPRKTPSSTTQPQSQTRRRFPASSSASSLNSVGEEIGEISTLLPTSPAKLRHLLEDEELISHEQLVEMPSFLLPAPKPDQRATVSPRKYETMRERETPSSSRTTRAGNGQYADEGNVTLDVGALMAKMSKPKRASGTEESFVDLLKGEDRPDELDMWVNPRESIEMC